MTAVEMNRLHTLFREIEARLESGETSSPELAKLFTEVSTLQSGDDVWFNLDPKGTSDLARLDAQFQSGNDGASPRSAAGWR